MPCHAMKKKDITMLQARVGVPRTQSSLRCTVRYRTSHPPRLLTNSHPSFSRERYLLFWRTVICNIQHPGYVCLHDYTSPDKRKRTTAWPTARSSCWRIPGVLVPPLQSRPVRCLRDPDPRGTCIYGISLAPLRRPPRVRLLRTVQSMVGRDGNRSLVGGTYSLRTGGK